MTTSIERREAILREKLEGLTKQYKQLKEELSIKRNDYILEQDNVRKYQINRVIGEYEHKLEEVDERIIRASNELEVLPHLAFPKRLYECLLDYDFRDQKRQFRRFLDYPTKIGTFVISSTAKYDRSKEQKWFWRHVLVNKYFNEKKVYELHLTQMRTTSVFDIVYQFYTSIGIEYEGYIESELEIDQELDALLDGLISLAQHHIVVLPFYIHRESHSNLIKPFLELVWFPICEKLKIREDEIEHEVFLFIMDDKASLDIYANDFEECMDSFKPFPLKRIENANKVDLLEWFEDQYYESKGVFKKHNVICNSLWGGDQYCHGFDFGHLLPECGTVEKLFGNICEKVWHSEFTFENLIKDYGR